MRACTFIQGSALALLLAVALCSAEGEARPTKEPDFWSEIADPGRRQYEESLKQGKTLLKRAGDLRIYLPPNKRGRRDPRKIQEILTDIEARRRKLYGQALAAFQRAARASPHQGRAHFWIGRLLSVMDNLSGEDRSLQIIRAFHRARKLDPNLGANERYLMAFQLGLAHSKRNELTKAVQEYDRALKLVEETGAVGRSRERAINYYNSAECLMALGRLDESIRRYQLSVSNYPSNALYKFGLAVALDRDEQVGKALEYARQAVSADQQMKELTDPSVFFLPDGEIHYYFALGYLAQGELPKARERWKLFLKQLPHSPWAFRARAHLARPLDKAASTNKRLAPRPGSTVTDVAEQERRRIRLRLQNTFRPIYRCYNMALKKRPNLGGRMGVTFSVVPSGKIRDARVSFSTVEHRALHRCVLGKLRSAAFPGLRSKKPLKMSYTFEFRPIR